jgi:small subunit ribosomal protein S1
MAADNQNPDIEEEQSFEALLESYTDGMNEDIQVGDQIRGKIISIGQDTVYMDTGTKIDGVVEKAELLDENGELPFSAGDVIELYVVAMTESEVRLSKALSGIGGIQHLQEAFLNRVPVEGKVSETCKGGFRIEILQQKAFCPISQIDINYVETPENFVGNVSEFLITRFEENGRNIVVSRKKLLARELEKNRAVFYESLKTGDTYTGKIARILPFGVFVELAPGVDGLVHISELSWTRVENPEELVAVGDTLTVRVIKVEESDKKGLKKIGLSARQALADPWETVSTKFSVDSRVTGKVTRCMKFGAFVAIAPGIEGLVHISEMSYTKRVLHPEDEVSKGQTVSVMIKDIDSENRRISLSLKDAEGDPWLEVEDRFKAGNLVKGTVEKKEGFGLFINLAPGITGLMPKSKISQSENPAKIETCKSGDTLKVVIERVNSAERKITLAPADAAQTGDWKNYSEQVDNKSMGTLAEKLQQALLSKK